MSDHAAKRISNSLRQLIFRWRMNFIFLTNICRYYGFDAIDFKLNIILRLLQSFPADSFIRIRNLDYYKRQRQIVKSFSPILSSCKDITLSVNCKSQFTDKCYTFCVYRAEPRKSFLQEADYPYARQ